MTEAERKLLDACLYVSSARADASDDFVNARSAVIDERVTPEMRKAQAHVADAWMAYLSAWTAAHKVMAPLGPWAEEMLRKTQHDAQMKKRGER